MIGRSILSNGAGLVVAGVVSFLIAPLMIHHLGATFYGIWVLAGSLLDYSGLIDTGMRTALFRFVAGYHGTGDREGLNRTLANALALTGGSAVIVLAVLPGLAVWTPGWFVTGATARAEFRETVVLVGLSLAFTFPARALGSYMSGVRRFDLFNLGTIATLLVRNGLIALLLIEGRGIVALAAATLAAAVFGLGFQAVLLRWGDPGAQLRWRLATWNGVKELIGYGAYAFGALCGESLRSYTDAIVIARVLSVALITPFNIATRLIEYMKFLFSAAGSPLMGLMSELEGRGERAWLCQVFLRSTRYFALGAFFTGGLFWLDGRALIELWVGASYSSSYPLLLALALGYVFSCAQLPSNLLLFATARHRFLAWLTLAEGGVNLGLSVLWGRQYGLMGVALGTTLPLLAACVLVEPVYVLRVTGIPLRTYVYEGFMRPAAAAALFLAVASVPGWPEAEGSWSHLLLAGTCQTGIFAACAAALGLDRRERREIWKSSRGALQGLRTAAVEATR